MTTNTELLTALDKMTARSGKLTKEVATLNTELDALSNYSQRSRRFIWMMLVSIILDIGMSIALAVVAVSNRDLAEKASRASSSTTVACVSSNASNKTQKELWEFLFKFPPPPGETPAARAQRLKTTVQFKTYINKAFAQRKC